MKKRILCFLFALLLTASLLIKGAPVSKAVTYITDPSQISGSDFSTAYAARLDALFQGSAPIFTNTTETFPLGASLDVNKSYVIANTYSGYQCYIYAQAAYYYLFGDVPRHGDGSLYWSDSEKVLTNKTSASYSLFSNAGVGFGAYLRTTTNTDGSYNGNGHSMIILAYDTTGLTYLEGNADGRGLIRVTTRTWEEFNANQLTAKGRRIGCIVQCNSAVQSHDFDDMGVCADCGNVFDFAATFQSDCAGRYAVTASDGICLRTQMPYDADAERSSAIPAGTEVEVLGSVTNAFGEVWYQVSYDGMTGYAPADALSWVGFGEQEISCAVTSPAEGQVVPKASFPVIGTVTSKYPLKEVTAYIDGVLYATVATENTTTLNLRSTAVNQKLSFSSLASGTHTLTIKARDIYHDAVTVCTRNFITETTAGDLAGDINCDGSLATDDAIYLLLHIMFGQENYPVSDTANIDLDGSGIADTDDAVYLLLHVMFGAADYPLV